jgi:hypothetical protein
MRNLRVLQLLASPMCGSEADLLRLLKGPLFHLEDKNEDLSKIVAHLRRYLPRFLGVVYIVW